MNQESKKIKSFTDLVTWQKGHSIALKVYSITKQFPTHEVFGLSSQLRRAAVSFTSNIAEGFGRKSYKEKVHFYSIALGSLTELQNQLLLAKDIGYLPEEEFRVIEEQAIEANKLVNGLIKKSNLIHNS